METTDQSRSNSSRPEKHVSIKTCKSRLDADLKLFVYVVTKYIFLLNTFIPQATMSGGRVAEFFFYFIGNVLAPQPNPRSPIFLQVRSR